MAAPRNDAALNDLLVTLRRSLLQYVAEAWPWTEPGTDGERAVIMDAVARQERSVGRIVELLQRRNWPIDFGIYPAEYTDLHYMALDYLLALLVESEAGVLNEVEYAKSACAVDPEALPLLDEIVIVQGDIVTRLRDLARSRRNGTPGTVVAPTHT